MNREPIDNMKLMGLLITQDCSVTFLSTIFECSREKVLRALRPLVADGTVTKTRIYKRIVYRAIPPRARRRE